MDITTAFTLIKDNTQPKQSIKAKITKLLESHSIKDRTQDISVIYDVFRSNEEAFISKEVMPSDWKSKRAYAAGFQAMRVVIDIGHIKEHLVSKYGDDTVTSLKERLHFYEKKFDMEYKHEHAREMHTQTNVVNTTSVSDGDFNEDSSTDEHHDSRNDESPSHHTIHLYEQENKILKKQLKAAFKVILELYDLETDQKSKRLLYCMYENIISMND